MKILIHQRQQKWAEGNLVPITSQLTEKVLFYGDQGNINRHFNQNSVLSEALEDKSKFISLTDLSLISRVFHNEE